MLCKVIHCAGCVSTIPGLISCAGVTGRWGLHARERYISYLWVYLKMITGTFFKAAVANCFLL